MFVGDSPTASSGEVAEDSRETTYLERKALAAQGIWGRVRETESGCWEWMGPKAGPERSSYGSITLGMSRYKVHRLIVQIFNGYLAKGEMACHSCGNKLCINPKHLAVGDAQDNSHDAVEEHRAQRPAWKKATKQQASEMRALYASGEWSLKEIADRYGVNKCYVRDRVKGIKRPGLQPLMEESDPVFAEAKKLYVDGGWTIRQLATRFGISYWKMHHRLRGLVRPDRNSWKGKAARRPA